MGMSAGMLILAAALTGGAAGAQDKHFNLDCTGAETNTTSGAVIWTTPFRDTLRIDLSQRLWCRETCWAHVRLDHNDKRYYYLTDANGPEGLHQMVYDSLSHLLTEVTTMGGSVNVTHANCVVRPFTGFPRNVKPPRLPD
jgi:hypothetical protein